jgi:hypothetical protein
MVTRGLTQSGKVTGNLEFEESQLLIRLRTMKSRMAQEWLLMRSTMTLAVLMLSFLGWVRTARGSWVA